MAELPGTSPPTAPGFGPGGPGVAPGPGEPGQSPNDPYAYVDPSLERPGAVADGLIGGNDIEPTAPEPNAAAARAVAAYRQRLQRWLSAHFVVSGTGLSREELRKLSIQATLIVDDHRTLVRYEVHANGNAALAVAARRALDAVVGQALPSPPEHYPGPLQRRIAVKFVCTEATCD